jgi:stearoyl-CoA desaturase (delta-9 desaturase)
LFQGYELYKKESLNTETLRRFGHGTPNDWVERYIYTRHCNWGIALMFLIDVVLFGASGLVVWAVQMAWTPLMAAGIINGAAHFWGYRNFEAPDASTNISPWGILIAGEELHNNHHTYPTSARLSIKPYEFDIGWAYIRMLQSVGLAKVKKTPPKAAYGDIRPVADEKTLEALIANRYEIMASYAHGMRQTARAEFAAMRAKSADAAVVRAAKRWMHRDQDRVPAAAAAHLVLARAASPVLDKMVTMREELRQMWLNTHVSPEQLALDLQAWCRRAEESGIAMLREFSMQLRAAQVQAS